MLKKILSAFLSCSLMMCTISKLSLPVFANTDDELGLATHATGCLDHLNSDDLEISMSESDELGTQYELQATIPKAFDISTDSTTKNYFPPIGNQGEVGSCTAWATTYYQFTYEVNRLRGINTTEENSYSPTWTYNYTNKGVDKGSNIVNAYGILKNQGAMQLKDLPYYSSLEQYSFDWPTNVEKMLDALHYRADYESKFVGSTSSSDFTRIKQKIADGHIAVVTTDIENWKTAKNSSGEYFVVTGSRDYKSSHAMAVVGYDDNIKVTVNGTTLTGAFKVVNSWGEDWGNSGYIWVCYDALNLESAYNTGWDDSYNINRCRIFLSNYFYFITVYECDADFCGRLRFTSDDSWSVSIYGHKSTDATFPKKGIYVRSNLSTASTRYLVFDYTEPGNARDVNDCLSSQWNINMTGDSMFYLIRSEIVDCLNEEIEPFDRKSYAMVDGAFEKTHNVNIAKGRISSYDNNDITQEDIQLLQSFLLGEETLSSLQYKLADYDNNKKVNGMDLAAMRQHIAGVNGTAMSLEECVYEIETEVLEKVNRQEFSFDEFMNGEMVDSADLLL